MTKPNSPANGQGHQAVSYSRSIKLNFGQFGPSVGHKFNHFVCPDRKYMAKYLHILNQLKLCLRGKL
jgi:hypothetical protein